MCFTVVQLIVLNLRVRKAYFGGHGRRYYVQHCATLATFKEK
jgi:hypothetical protein